jgi:hypothetical protein
VLEHRQQHRRRTGARHQRVGGDAGQAEELGDAIVVPGQKGQRLDADFLGAGQIEPLGLGSLEHGCSRFEAS